MKVQFKKGESIFKQNDAGDCAYLIDKGRVQIQITKNNEEVPLSMIGESEIFGEMALLDNLNRSASAIAAEDCTLIIVTKDQLLDRVHSSDIIVRLLMQLLLKRLRNQNDQANQERIPLNFKEDLEGLNKIKLENKIYDAFKNNEFLLYHQPIIDLSSRTIVGSEALLRWQSPTEGMISPALFIDLIENSSIIIPIGEWIIEESFRHMQQLQKKKSDFSVSINISGRQFIHHEFTDHLVRTQKQAGIQAQTVKLEMTERLLMEGLVVLDTLNRCRELGYQISIDDFGTGFSSLQYLSKMPIDFIKIDSSFVQKMQTDHKTEAVVRSIIYLAQALKIKIISEGVETEAQMNKLIELGSEYAQGYLFSKPLTLSEIILLKYPK
jgi:EAL domain-containing protein (putative c-di-GMP-specific phosphodiesterase class I)